MSKDFGPRFNPETETRFNGILMRDFVPNDRQKFREFHDAFSSDEGVKDLLNYFGLNPDLDLFEVLMDPDSYRHTTIVLGPKERLVGIGNYYDDIPPDPEHVLLGTLIVPEYQGRGIGPELIRHLIRRCSQLDPKVTQMTTRTLSSNVRAIRSFTTLQKTIGGFTGYRSDGFVDFNFSKA